MNAIRVVVSLEIVQLSREIDRIPEVHSVKIFAANVSDQPFDERMRDRGVGNRLELLDLEHA